MRRSVMPVFRGSGVALVTPFKEDYSVDYERLAELVEFQISGGTDAIISCGTTGEASTLTHEEHLEVVRQTVKMVGGRIPVIAGTGSNCTETAIFLSQEAEKAGADALLIVTPYYNKATQKGLYEHFKTIAKHTNLPIILYNVPSRTGLNLAPATAVSLANDIANIVGIKEASGNISQVAQLAHLASDETEIYSGNDDQNIPILSLGGIGAISVLANIAPRQTHEMLIKYLDGDVAGARKMQLGAIPLIEAIFCEVSPTPVKKALQLMGRDSGVLRRPLYEMEAQNVPKLEKALKEYGLLS
jgi:4-hydroxy-tetrahydrodipicolinate synthase